VGTDSAAVTLAFTAGHTADVGIQVLLATISCLDIKTMPPSPIG